MGATLKAQIGNNATSSTELKGWNSNFTLSPDGNTPTCIWRCTPGQAVRMEVKGRVWNNKGDSCIHQLLLALNTTIVAELSDGVPGRGRSFTKKAHFTAP